MQTSFMCEMGKDIGSKIWKMLSGIHDCMPIIYIPIETITHECLPIPWLLRGNSSVGI